MKASKTISLLLLAAMLLTGCSSGADNSADNAAQITEASEQTAETTTASEYIIPETKYDGAQVTLASYEVTSNWMSLQYTDAYAEAENGDILNDAIFFRNRAVEEALDVKLGYQKHASTLSNPSEFNKLILAGEDVIDAAYINTGSLPKMLGQDLLVDLYTVDTIDLTHSWWDSNAVEGYTLYDKLYCATGDISLFLHYSPIALFANKAILENLNLESPYKLVRDGAWTVDKMIEYSTKAAGDIDGDGKMTIADRFGLLCEPKSLPVLIQAAGIKFSEKNSDGEPEITINSPKTAELVEKLVPFMNNKSVNMLSTNYSSQYKSVFTDLYLPVFNENRALFYKNQLHISLNLRNMESDFGVLPLPKYNEAQDEYIGILNDYFTTAITIPVTNGNVDMTGAVIEALGYYGQQYVTKAFIDVTITDKAIRDEDSTEMLNIIFDNMIVDLGVIYNWGNVYSMVTSLVSNNSTDYASLYASNESAINQALAKTIEDLK